MLSLCGGGNWHRGNRTHREAIDRAAAFCHPFFVSQPVKLSDELVLDARLAGKAFGRSISGQVEYWAKLGRALEPLLQGVQIMALCRNAGARPLSECLETVDTPEGRTRVQDHLQNLPFPHYEQHPSKPELLIRIKADGCRTTGRFVNRQFEPEIECSRSSPRK